MQKSEKGEKLVELVANCPNNSKEFSTNFQWIWRSINMVESAHFPNLCWAPLYKGGKIVLSLAQCDSQAAMQVLN